MNMKKTLLAMLTLSTVVFTSTSALAMDLAEDMDILNDNYNIVLKTDQIDEFKHALNTMRGAALDAQKQTPPKLENKAPDSPEMKDFQHGLTILVSQIDGAMKLADAGQLDKAKQAAEDFKTTRTAYHKKYR